MSTIISLDVILKESRWVAKMQGYRQVGTYDELKSYAESEECRDFDLCVEQPDKLKPFFDRYFAYERENGFITIPEYYKDIYLVDMQEEKPKKRVWTEDEIRDLIQTNDTVLYGALKKLYACQTSDEQDAGFTKIHNGVGFNSADSKFLSSISEFLLKRGFLTNKQKYVTRKKLVKYTRQLTKLANA